MLAMKKLLLPLLLISSQLLAQTKCVAHRGFKGQSLENSLRSIKEAYKAGADAIEFDVRMTKDGIPIIMHDARLVRTVKSRTGKNCDLIFKKIKSNTYEKINEHCVLRNGEDIPTLESFFEYLHDKDVEAFVELKHQPNAKVAELINKYYAHQLDKIKILSSSKKTYETLIEVDQFRNAKEIDFFKTDIIPFNKKKDYHASYWHVGDKIASLTKYPANRKIYVWTIDSEKIMKKYFAKGVDYIASNVVDRCVKIRVQQVK